MISWIAIRKSYHFTTGIDRAELDLSRAMRKRISIARKQNARVHQGSPIPGHGLFPRLAKHACASGCALSASAFRIIRCSKRRLRTRPLFYSDRAHAQYSRETNDFKFLVTANSY